MPMQTQTKERIYLLIMVFCLLMCAVLLISVFCDLPIAAVVAAGEVHNPAIRAPNPAPAVPQGGGLEAPTAGENGLAITQEYLEAELGTFIPQSFPATEIEVEILGGGGIEFELTVYKDDLKTYLDQVGVGTGVKQTLAIALLPDTFEIEAVLVCAKANSEGLELALDSLNVNDKQVDLGFLPANLFEVLSAAVNATLALSGNDWNNVVFAPGVLYLR